tara:strand:- start:1330 stop:2211 length:882 start_codon:yes stop_codon:yes gene_type:complete
MTTRRTRSRTAHEHEHSLPELLSDDELSCVVEHCVTSSVQALHACNQRFARLAGVQLRRTALTLVLPGDLGWGMFGQYQLCDELVNGRPSYSHTTHPTWRMEYTSRGTWILGYEVDDDDDDEDDDGAWALESLPGSMLPTQVAVWQAPDGVVIGMKCLDGLMVAQQLQAASTRIALVGTTPNGWRTNWLGFYDLHQRHFVNGRPAYHLRWDWGTMLWHDGEGRWVIGSRKLLGTSRGFLIVRDSSLLPHEIQSVWTLLVPSKSPSRAKCGKWRCAPKLKIRSTTLPLPLTYEE